MLLGTEMGAALTALEPFDVDVIGRMALKQYTPLDLINTILLDAMRTVGDLFGGRKMQLPLSARFGKRDETGGRLS